MSGDGYGSGASGPAGASDGGGAQQRDGAPDQGGEPDPLDAADPLDGPAASPEPGTTPTPGLDAGLQRERTALAWDRTALALILVGALVVRSMGDRTPLWQVPGYLAVAWGAVLLALDAGPRRRPRAAADAPLRTRRIRATGVVVVAISCVALVLVFVA